MSQVARNTAEALKNQGNAQKAAGDLQGAIESYRRALEVEPDYVPALYNLGLVFRELQQFDEAEACFRRVLAVEPRDVDALFNLGALLRRSSRLGEADEVFRRALELAPDNPYLWLKLGDVCGARHTDASLREAAECFRRAVELRPDLADAHYGLGNAYMAAGHPEAAAHAYRETLRLDPENAVLMLDLASTLRALGQRAEAMSLISRVLEIEPGLSGAQNLLGMLLQDEGRLDEALEHYRRAVALAPNEAGPHNNLACIQGLQGQLDEAVRCFRRAIELQPDYVEAHVNLGNIYGVQGRRDLALRSFEAAHELSPHDPDVTAGLLFEMQYSCDWSLLNELCQARRDDIRAHPGKRIDPFSLLSIPSTRQEQLRAARSFAQHELRAVAGEQEQAKFSFARQPKRRLKIGYLSADFHEHAIAYLAAELFELHDRERFEIYGYSYGPDDGSAMRARLALGFDRFIDIRALPHAEAARAIHQDGIDILVDLKGYTTHARTGIVALRPAPIQVSYLGYPGTMGAEFIDYLVADSFVTPPDHEADYSEKLVLMPGSYQVNDRRRPIADTPPREQLGLPEHGFVFCCFNQSYKILPEMFAAWLRLLQAVPESVLWLLDSNPWAAQNLRREAGDCGVDPGRLVFGPRLPLDRHLGRLRAADLFLDTRPYNAHTTASDALWAGLPVLTCAGDTFVSRVAGSLLTAAGLPELITCSMADYEALALRLARDPARLAALREKLARSRNTAPLFDTPGFVRQLEAAYERMWKRYLSGEPPGGIAL